MDTCDNLWDNYKDISDTTSDSRLYNGNISWMNIDLPGLDSDRMQAMVYGYDQLHRIPDTLRYRDRLSRPGALRNMGPLAMYRGAGMIPEKYLNIQDLGGISNVILSGVNPTGSQDIYDIGIRIVKEISSNYRCSLQMHHHDNGTDIPQWTTHGWLLR